MKKYDQGVGDPLGMPVNSYNVCMQDSSSLSSQGVNVRCSMRRVSRVRKRRRLRVANSERGRAGALEPAAPSPTNVGGERPARCQACRSRGTLTCDVFTPHFIEAFWI